MEVPILVLHAISLTVCYLKYHFKQEECSSIDLLSKLIIIVMG